MSVVNVIDFGAAGDELANDLDSLQAAIDGAGEYGTVIFPSGTYCIDGRLTPLSGQTWVGEGKRATVIKGAGEYDYAVSTDGPLHDFRVSDMTFDVDNVACGSGIQLYNAQRCTVENVEFMNVASGGWMLKFGVNDGLNDETLCLDNRIVDCDFDTQAGTLEMLLLFNCKNTWVIRPTFKNKTTAGPSFGLWQKCYGTKIVDAHFRDCQGPNFYYSVTTEDTWLTNPSFDNCGHAIQGANTSDNGNFGQTVARDLYVTNARIKGGSNSTSSVAIQLGAIDGVKIDRAVIDGYQIGINLNNGNHDNNSPTTNWSITDCTIRNGNPEDNHHAIHPGILFSEIGGEMYGHLAGNLVYDDRVVKKQRYPVAFEGPYTWKKIRMVDNYLSPEPVKLNGTAKLIIE